MTNYYKFSSFKQLFIICSYKSEFGHSITGFSAQGLNKAEIKVSEGIHYPEFSVLLQAHLGFWQNSVPFSHRTKVPFFLLAVS